MNNPFLKYMMKDEKEDIFHTSAYGKAQSGCSMGITSTGSSTDRMKVNQNRKVVQGYNKSDLAESGIGNGPRAKQYVPPENKK